MDLTVQGAPGLNQMTIDLLLNFAKNGAKAIAEEATNKAIDANFFTKNAISELAKLSDYELGKLGRISEPLFKPSGKEYYQSISWNNAFDVVTSQIQKLNSPNESVFYTSGRTSNEAAFLYQLFIRMLGTNNLPDCSNMCHESSGVALKESIGIGKGTVKFRRF